MNNGKEEIRGLGSDPSFRFELNESKKEAGLVEIARAVQEKKIRYYPSFFTCMLNQLQYQTWQSRFLQGGMLLLALVLGLWMNKANIEDTQSLILGSVFMAVAANVCLSTVGSLFSRNMAELEQTLNFNLKQMVCIQMLEAGILDFLILALIMVLGGSLNQAGAGGYLLYLLVPFLWSNIVYLHMLTFLKRRGMGGTATGVLCGMGAVFPAFVKNAYDVMYLPLWGVAALAGILVLALEIKRLLGKIEGGEGLCLN